MKKYYTRACNFYYGSNARSLIKKNLALPLCGNKNIAFDRIEIFENNTQITFIFFNVLVMVLLTTLVVKYNPEFVYLVPLCILPLTLKAFFDARLGLFTHVITVLLLGFIVPNSYEYMFLQILSL